MVIFSNEQVKVSVKENNLKTMDNVHSHEKSCLQRCCN